MKRDTAPRQSRGPKPERPETTRINFDVRVEVREQLQRVRELSGARTQAEVLHAALTEYERVLLAEVEVDS